MPTIDLSILNQRQTPAFYADVFANRPAAGFVGRIFVSTNTFAFYRDNGTGWDLIGGPGTGTITGSGSFGSIALWNGTDTITYDVGLTWDGTANSLTASKFIVTGGTSSQFLKADGSVDSSSYVPYTGATASLDLGANNLLGQNFFVRGDDISNGGFLGFKQFNGTSSGQTGYTSISALQQNSLYFQFSQTNGTNKTFELSAGLLGTTARQFQFPDASGTIALTSNIPSVSGAASQVAFFSGTNAITGENNLWWDSVNNHFGINTNTPGTALDIHHDQSTLVQLNQTTATNDTRIAFQNSGTALWRIGNFYNAGANDWGIFDVVGAAQPFTIKKTTGQVLIGTSTVGSGKLVVASATGDNGVQIVGASAPSLRIDNAESGPTKRAGLGISTAVNNFIQGSADRDFCMFNGSTTASPILFGIYDTTNVQEAARISAARNLIVGRTTDSGEKLQVLGQSKFLQSSANIVSIFEGDWDRNTTNNNQIYVRGYSNTNKQLRIGFDTTGDYGYLQALISGTGTNAIALNPSGGDIGIGTITPGSKLDVTNTVGTAYNSANTLISGQTMRISNLSTNSNVAASLLFNAVGSGGGNGLGSISGVSTGTGSLALTFAGRNAGASLAEGMRLTGLGNLLIGTTTDNGAKLQVNGNTTLSATSTPEILMTDTGSGRTCLIANDSNNAFFRTANGNNFLFQVSGGATALTIKSTRVINISAIPTSAAGLVSGDIYSNLGVLTIVP